MRVALVALLVLCSSPALASHPLVTEDTGVLEERVWQLELHGGRARDSRDGVATRSTEVSAVLGYGVAARTELQVELPYVREVTDGEVVKGRGDAVLAAKWRFLERGPLSMVLKPELVLPTGRDELGLGAGRAQWGVNLAAAYELGRLETIAHVGYRRNRNVLGEREGLWHRSLALLWSATGKLRLVLDFALDTHPDPGPRAHERVWVYGATYALRDHIDLGLGIKKGLNAEADDRTLVAGLKLRW
jgi:hypothetical protein